MLPSRLTLAFAALSATAPAQILVNEVGTGSKDFIEILNAGAAPVDLQGWSVRSYETRGNSRPCSPPLGGSFGLVTQYAFPTGVPFMLAPGAVLAFVEYGTAGHQPSPGVIETGSNIYFHDASDCEVWVENSVGQVQDYVVFGDVVIAEVVLGTHVAPGAQWQRTPVIRPRTGGSVVARQNQPQVLDTGTAADWVVAGEVAASPGAQNPVLGAEITAYGEGFGGPATCSAVANGNLASALPALCWTDLTAGAPVLGGQLRLAVSSGMASPPAADALLISAARTPGVPVCAGGAGLWVVPAGVVLSPMGVSYDLLGAGDLPAFAIPNNPWLRGRALFAQAFFYDPSTPGCGLRATQGLEIVLR